MFSLSNVSKLLHDLKGGLGFSKATSMNLVASQWYGLPIFNFLTSSLDFYCLIAFGCLLCQLHCGQNRTHCTSMNASHRHQSSGFGFDLAFSQIIFKISIYLWFVNYHVFLLKHYQHYKHFPVVVLLCCIVFPRYSLVALDSVFITFISA